MLAISASTVSFPTFGLVGEPQSVCLVHKQDAPLSFLNDFRNFSCGASNIFRDKITMLYLHDFFAFIDTDIFEYTIVNLKSIFYWTLNT